MQQMCTYGILVVSYLPDLKLLKIRSLEELFKDS